MLIYRKISASHNRRNRNRRFKNPQQQKQLFVQHIEMAQQYNRPLIIHAVKAVSYFDDLWNKLPEKFMFHSFNGKVEYLKIYYLKTDMCRLVHQY